MYCLAKKVKKLNTIEIPVCVDVCVCVNYPAVEHSKIRSINRCS